MAAGRKRNPAGSGGQPRPAAAADLPVPAPRLRGPPLRRVPRVSLKTCGKITLYGALCCTAMALFSWWSWLPGRANIGVGWPGLGDGRGRMVERQPVGPLWFRPSPDLVQRLKEGRAEINRLRSGPQLGTRPPRLAVVVGGGYEDSEFLLLLTVVGSLQNLGYTVEVFAVREWEAHTLWQKIGCEVSVLGSQPSSYVDWSNYEGVLASSLEVKTVMSSLMQGPFCSVPVVWLIQEDALGKQLSVYASQGWQALINDWKSAFRRADVVVFPDYSLPMLYTSLDSGNFYVISGVPMDTWVTKKYTSSRKDHGFGEDDLIILVIGSYFYYDEMPRDFSAVMDALGPALKNERVLDENLKLIFLFGNSTEVDASVVQDLASRKPFSGVSVKYYGLDGDVNSVVFMADVVLYASFQEEQSFPPLLVRAMSFQIPIIVPDLSIVKRHVVDQHHGLIYHRDALESLAKAFSLLITNRKMSALAHLVASQGKLLSRNMFARECMVKYAMLLEDVLQFQSDVMLPASVSQIHQRSWLWDLLKQEDRNSGSIDYQTRHRSSILYVLEEQYLANSHKENTSDYPMQASLEEYPTQQDWDDLSEMEAFEDSERREVQEIEERSGRTLGSWEDVYRNARKAEKPKSPERNERDEGDLERIGQPLCIYEVYNGEGSWPFLHHGSLYRGISLSRNARRVKSDDVDAVSCLPMLNDTYYRDLICEFAAMFSIAKEVDSIHRIPWIGFQSWRSAGKKVSLSNVAEKVLEDTIQAETQGEVVYYWALMDVGNKNTSTEESYDFWSMCDIMNGGQCRTVFEDAFRHMYGLPDDISALPPMPDDGDRWSALHSWVMPTSSFLEFIMFSRMFADSLDTVVQNTSNPSTCVLGSSRLQSKHCYCRILEILVNVWAYHSARKMVYLDPISGELIEQHPIEDRLFGMRSKFFNFDLLKGMDEDLAEEADDAANPRERWLWPMTGEVHWQGIFERERMDRYKRKQDKSRRTKEKILDRQKHGYKQKSLGG